MVSDLEAKAIIARNLKRILEEQGHSRYWLAQQTGDDESKISRVINEKTIANAGFLMRVANALSVSLDDLTTEQVERTAA